MQILYANAREHIREVKGDYIGREHVYFLPNSILACPSTHVVMMLDYFFLRCTHFHMQLIL